MFWRGGHSAVATAAVLIPPAGEKRGPRELVPLALSAQDRTPRRRRKRQDLMLASIKSFVSVLLGISPESIESFLIVNSEIRPENLGDKFCRLDIHMVINGQFVDLEVQVNNEGDYPERVLLYWAKDFSSALAAGQDYSMLPQTIVINLVDFRLFDCVEFHSFFQILEV